MATNEHVEAYVVGGEAGGSDLWELPAAANKIMTYPNFRSSVLLRTFFGPLLRASSLLASLALAN